MLPVNWYILSVAYNLQSKAKANFIQSASMANQTKVGIRHQSQLIRSLRIEARGVKQTCGMRMLGKLTMQKIRGSVR